MKIYKFTTDPDNYNSLHNLGDFSAFYVAKPLAPGWEPPYREEDRTVGKAGDFPSLIGGVPVFSLRAWEVLRPLIDNTVEALPLETDGGSYYMIHVLDHIDALDYARAEVTRFSEGDVMWVDSYAFKPGLLKGKHMFKLPESARSLVYVSEAFKTLVEKAGLEGLNLEYLAEAD
jgi:hypothetical protein